MKGRQSGTIDSETFAEVLGNAPDAYFIAEALQSSDRDWHAIFTMLDASGWKVVLPTGYMSVSLETAGLTEGEQFAVSPCPDVEVHFAYTDSIIFVAQARLVRDQESADALAELIRRIGNATGRDVVVREDRYDSPPVLHYQSSVGERRTLQGDLDSCEIPPCPWASCALRSCA